MAMQNYAKFESSISADSARGNMIEQSFGGSNYYGNSFLSELFNFIGDLLGFLLGAIIAFSVVFTFFFFVYMIVSLFTKGGEKTMGEVKMLGTSCINMIKRFIYGIVSYLKRTIKCLWNRKYIVLAAILLLAFTSFGKDVINGQSRFLKLDKINPGYVGIDLKNSRLLQPGYHLYSPLKTSVFLSPTNDFSFQIAEVTANSSEELGVTLDYKVGFQLIDDKRLDFYNKFGAKNIRLVSSEIVMPRLLEVIKGTIKNYSFKDISSKHDEIKEITITEANKKLKELGVSIQDITIIDIRLPKSYLSSKEELLKAENGLKLAEARFEAQKKESEKRLLEAKNLKEVKIIEAEALAEYNKIVKSESVTDNMLEMKKLENETLKIKKWDGKMPSTVGDNSGL
ncbi:hypothetical protein A9Q91_02645 [Candidatus Gracilibacteria bacterium 28_42_T64]|nr:hypothetical protein A9Q91_02645 [Candidatus Gracilibacteria bacterium 28_42_T64]